MIVLSHYFRKESAFLTEIIFTDTLPFMFHEHGGLPIQRGTSGNVNYFDWANPRHTQIDIQGLLTQTNPFK